MPNVTLLIPTQRLAGDRKIYRLADLEDWLKDHQIAPLAASAENTNKPDSDCSVLKHKSANEQRGV